MSRVRVHGVYSMYSGYTDSMLRSHSLVGLHESDINAATLHYLLVSVGHLDT